MSKKTTIAINTDSRKKLSKIKKALEFDRNRFVDMDEVLEYLLEVCPKSMKVKIENV